MGTEPWKPPRGMYTDERGSTKIPPSDFPRNVAPPRKNSGPQTLRPEDNNILESRDVGHNTTKDEDQQMPSRYFDGQQPENRMSRQETEIVEMEPVVTDPATERLEDEGGMDPAESVSLSFNPPAVLRGRDGARSTSPTNANWLDWVLVDLSINPATRSQSLALPEHQQIPTVAPQDQDVLQLHQTPARDRARGLDRKSWSSNATRFALASSLSGPPTQAHQVQHSSSLEHVGSGESPSGMDRSPGGRRSLLPVKHSQRLPWDQGDSVYNAQQEVANGGHFVEGQKLREASGECPDANHSEDSSWYHVSVEEVQHVDSSSSNPRRATNRMATQPEATREPQFTSFHLMGGIPPPRQPTYSEKRNAEPEHTPLLPPEVNVGQSGYMNQGVTKFNQQCDESRSLQARAIVHDANVSNRLPHHLPADVPTSANPGPGP